MLVMKAVSLLTFRWVRLSVEIIMSIATWPSLIGTHVHYLNSETSTSIERISGCNFDFALDPYGS